MPLHTLYVQYKVEDLLLHLPIAFQTFWTGVYMGCNCTHLYILLQKQKQWFSLELGSKNKLLLK